MASIPPPAYVDGAKPVDPVVTNTKHVPPVGFCLVPISTVVQVLTAIERADAVLLSKKVEADGMARGGLQDAKTALMNVIPKPQ